ncbi:hypothetical protein DMW62_04275 [Serratia marcescens]|uniref:DUF2913 family protein n=1 Tax=Serratia marcescens TaxID=615 RepID=A0ABX5NH38_SERMA|nr:MULTISPECIES: DUF2913 family protein [Serratia]MDI9110335.1 DUF2913 family protein [Serratia marcescens]MDR8536426.1 DUF2913 family protein [Serratia nevei]PXZ92266.1 hypothetical protein CW300_22215 [Serratia marcescens]PYA12875.1 hypothetical protein DMW42_19765 [Serratia marcescens]PYA20865.1 hypothetical protein DMW41_21495 [Serratia marcescens]
MKTDTQGNEPEITILALSNLAFCALVALSIARQDGIAGNPLSEHLFLVRWLATAQKQKRFPKCVAIDIAHLLEQGRKTGPASKLREKLQYLWQSCTEPLSTQSDLFRLTYVTEKLKEQGWKNFTLDNKSWKDERFPASCPPNGFYTEESALHAAYSDDGRLISPLDLRIVGDVDLLLALMEQSAISAELIERGELFHRVVLYPAPQ